MQNEEELKKAICETGYRLWIRGFVASNDGNISVRLSEDEILITPSGVSKGSMNPEMMMRINLDGEILDGKLKPSSETPMHLSIYRKRADINAIVHAHPPFSTGFAISEASLPVNVLPEALINLGPIARVPYATPGGNWIPEAMAPFLQTHQAFLLSNHGAVTIGSDLNTAYYRMETLEHYTHILWIARTLGGEKALTKEQENQLSRYLSK
jgi:L-fuculose-phosphate aldolase